MRPSAQSASLLRVGCQRSAKPSGESTISEPPALKMALPHSFSQGLMKVPMPEIVWPSPKNLPWKMGT